jgi:hypothetical protein
MRHSRELALMPLQVVTGAILQCSFGAVPSTLRAIPASRVMTIERARAG